jgi:VWFA-related protein
MTLQPRKYFTITALLIALNCYIVSAFYSVKSQERQGKDQKGSELKGQSDAVVRLETELVQIDVVVTDKEGKPVNDLTRHDFELLEDGKPQTISYFSVGASAGPAPQPAINSEAAHQETGNRLGVPENGPGRRLVLAVDDLHLSPGNLMQAKQALLRFVDRQLEISDEVALITTSGRLGLFQQFTTERDILRRAINRLNVQDRTNNDAGDVPRITPYQAELIDRGDPDALELAVLELISKFRMDRPTAVSTANSKARMVIAQNVGVTISTLSTIETIIRGLKPLPGRKVIALLSDGFLLGGLREGRHYDLRRITDAATKAGVVIYSIDARGLVAVPPTMDASQSLNDSAGLPGVRSRIENGSIEAQRDGLNALARDTGGIPIFNNNDLNLGLQRVLDDTRAYYLLAFEPAASYRDGRFRKLEVRVPGRSDLRVRTRKGYFSPDDQAAEKEARARAMLAEKEKQKSPDKLTAEAQAAKQTQIRKGLSALFPLRGIPLQMSASFINKPVEGLSGDIAAHLDASTLKFNEANDRYRATLEFIGMIFDENGKTAGSFSDRVDLNFTATALEDLKKNGINYSKFVGLNPGLFQVRLVVRELGVAEIGSASSWLEIPDLGQKKLALSSIFFPEDGEGSDPLSITPKEKDAVNDRDHSPLPPKVYRRFKRNTKLDFMIFAYNAMVDDKGTTDLAVQSQIHLGGKVLLATPLRSFMEQTTFGARKDAQQTGIPYLARLSLEKFQPGMYELKLVVIDRHARTSAKRSVSFTVE